jgi:hypothetical protein
MNIWADISLILLYVLGMFIAYNEQRPWLVFVFAVAFMQQVRIIDMKHIIEVQGLVIGAQFRAIKDYQEEIRCLKEKLK